MCFVLGFALVFWFFSCSALVFFFKPSLTFLVRFLIPGRKCSSAITIYFSHGCLSLKVLHWQKCHFTGTKVHGNAGDTCWHFCISHVLLFQTGLHEAMDLSIKSQVFPVHILSEKCTLTERSLLSAAHQLSSSGSFEWHSRVEKVFLIQVRKGLKKLKTKKTPPYIKIQIDR